MVEESQTKRVQISIHLDEPLREQLEAAARRSIRSLSGERPRTGFANRWNPSSRALLPDASDAKRNEAASNWRALTASIQIRFRVAPREE